MKKRGFTLIELLAVIVLLAVIALIATPVILGIIEDTKKIAFKDSAYGISGAAKNAFVEVMYAGEEPKDITYTYVDGVESSEPNGYNLNYEGAKPQNGQISLTKEGQVALAVHDGKYCATKGYDDAEVTIEEKIWSECNIPGSVIVDQSGANAPVLATGMTPVIWNGSSWITASNTDDSYKQNWYDYNNQKWANAKTADGSMWVWIPRYVYKISSGWHTNTAGTIDVQFSQGTNDSWNSAVIGALDTGTSSSASNNTWTNHPAFWWDNDSDAVREAGEELTGIWVAKFEATATEGVANVYATGGVCNIVGDNVTTKTVKIIPNARQWVCINIGNIFTVARNMETNNVYGWGTSGSGIDTHLIKNVEWGSVAYLSKSIYGINNEVGINNNNTHKTGCGAAPGSAATDVCNAYNTSTGMLASTTGTIYGIYDMSGGLWEYTSAYTSNGNSNLNTYGANIISAGSKYKDIYTTATDARDVAYNTAVNKKGDAVYETSSTYSDSNSWYGDYSWMPAFTAPWFNRSGSYGSTSAAGSFFFYYETGNANSYTSWRPTLIVGTGL